MTRLTHYKEHEENKRILIFAGGFLVLTIFLFAFGFKIIIGTTLFFSNLFSSKQTTVKNEDFYGTIDLDSVPTATNSARLVVSGTVSNFDTVEFFVNGTSVKETTLINTSAFSEEIGTLQKGQNELYAVAKTKKGNKSKATEKYSILYKKDKPTLQINEPKDKDTVHTQELKIAGKTDKDNTIELDHSPVVVDTAGNFQSTVRLKDGENKFTIIATDIAGNEEKTELTVNYQKED